MNIEFMKQAISEASKGHQYDEVPIGVVITRGDVIIARAHNEKEQYNQSTRHAEIVAIERASAIIGDWRLSGMDMYVTLEPCAMCSGAIINARLDNVYFGAYDPKAGCCGSLYNLPEDKRFNHRPNICGGILEDQCGAIISEFFRGKRNKGRKD